MGTVAKSLLLTTGALLAIGLAYVLPLTAVIAICVFIALAYIRPVGR